MEDRAPAPARQGSHARTAPWFAAAFALATVAAAPLAAADPDAASLCEDAALRASAESGVPARILRAVQLAETGRGGAGARRPWPWATNIGGSGRWHPTRAAARQAAVEAIAAGQRSVDIGCFQINHRWHGHAFDSVDTMLDPTANARYAAGFLAALYRETGDWTAAVGAYHSRTPALAAAYAARVATFLPEAPAQSAQAAPDGPAQPPTPRARMTYPLFAAQPRGPGPSLFAAVAAPRRPIATTARGPLIGRN